jgi:hypothetical protein
MAVIFIDHSRREWMPVVHELDGSSDGTVHKVYRVSLEFPVGIFPDQ